MPAQSEHKVLEYGAQKNAGAQMTSNAQKWRHTALTNVNLWRRQKPAYGTF